MKPDAFDRAKSTAIESDTQRRRRAIYNRRQRELYGPRHLRRRREFARRIERGELIVCPRCECPIGPDQAWDLGHDDRDPTWTRPEHRTCNRAAANALKTSRDW